MGREGDSYGSPELQLKDCRSWIAGNDHVERENVSGGALLARRPGLQAVIDRMHAGESDGVVVRAYDRFMRSVSLSWEVIELIEGRDGMGGIGRLFAAQGNVDFRTPTGRLLFTPAVARAVPARERSPRVGGRARMGTRSVGRSGAARLHQAEPGGQARSGGGSRGRRRRR